MDNNSSSNKCPYIHGSNTQAGGARDKKYGLVAITTQLTDFAPK